MGLLFILLNMWSSNGKESLHVEMRQVFQVTSIICQVFSVPYLQLIINENVNCTVDISED